MITRPSTPAAFRPGRYAVIRPPSSQNMPAVRIPTLPPPGNIERINAGECAIRESRPGEIVWNCERETVRP